MLWFAKKIIMAVNAEIQRNPFYSRSFTFECLIKFIFSKDNPQVVNSTGVKLHPENNISAWATVALVVALELECEKYRKKFKHYCIMTVLYQAVPTEFNRSVKLGWIAVGQMPFELHLVH